jgi:hypothetical protein
MLTEMVEVVGGRKKAKEKGRRNRKRMRRNLKTCT